MRPKFFLNIEEHYILKDLLLQEVRHIEFNYNQMRHMRDCTSTPIPQIKKLNVDIKKIEENYVNITSILQKLEINNGKTGREDGSPRVRGEQENQAATFLTGGR